MTAATDAKARTAVDETKVEDFVGTVLTNFGVAMNGVLVGIGDKLGLFKDLAAGGSATSSELAIRTSTNERYIREWLAQMSAIGYIAYDPVSTRFTLPPEHVPVLAEELGPMFFGGTFQMLLGLGDSLSLLVEAFRNGGGVPQSAYGADWWEGMSRFTSGWFENSLLQEWVPTMPDLHAKLEAGCSIADVGCGRGRGIVKLAKAFPRSTFVGYDLFAPWLDMARALAEEQGVADRVRFEERDCSRGLPERYDVVSTFDVVHDAVDPKGLLRSIREALPDDGVYVCLDIHCSENLEENVGPLGTTFYGFSLLYCMTTSLAGGGEGLGTTGFHHKKVIEYCTDAGFSSVRRVELDNVFNDLYEIRP